jgi:hypothetical protein
MEPEVFVAQTRPLPAREQIPERGSAASGMTMSLGTGLHPAKAPDTITTM